MKSTVELQELRSKETKELYKQLQELQKKLTQLRMGQSFRKLKNYHEITSTKKLIARHWTVLSEKILAEQLKLNK